MNRLSESFFVFFKQRRNLFLAISIVAFCVFLLFDSRLGEVDDLAEKVLMKLREDPSFSEKFNADYRIYWKNEAYKRSVYPSRKEEIGYFDYRIEGDLIDDIRVRWKKNRDVIQIINWEIK